MKKSFKKEMLSMLWLVACLLPLAACGSKPAAEPAAAASEPAGEPDTAPIPAYAIITAPLDADSSLLAPAVASASGAHVLLLEKLPKQLAETGIKSPFFSTLAVIRFPSEEQFENWQAPAAQALGDKASIKRVDLVVADGLQDAPRPGAYFAVNLYETLVPADQYKTYTNTYIVPNMANQKSSGVMASYSMYLERAGGQGNARSVLIKEYVSEEAFGKSGAIKDAHKAAVLLNDPEWKRIDGTKAAIRTDLNETLAKHAAQ